MNKLEEELDYADEISKRKDVLDDEEDVEIEETAAEIKSTTLAETAVLALRLGEKLINFYKTVSSSVKN